MNNTLRICRECKIEKEISHFFISGKNHKLRWFCTDCKNVKARLNEQKRAKQKRLQKALQEIAEILPDDQQRCSVCDEIKNLDKYYKQNSGNPWKKCKDCHRKNQRVKRGLPAIPEEKPVVTHKICKACNVSKEKKEFKDRTLTCIPCFNKIRKHKRRLEAAAKRESKKLLPPVTHKCCKGCEEIKVLSEFRLNVKGKYKSYNTYCYSCEYEISVAWKKNNREKVLLGSKKYHKSNKEKEAAYKKQYRAKPEVKKRASERDKQRAAEDPNYKLLRHLRTAVNGIIKRFGGKKSKRTMELLGCDIKTAREHIESKFEPWMTWENHGNLTWHLDHERPASLFDLTNEEEQKQCFHYTNLRPLAAIHNLSKNDFFMGKRVSAFPKTVIKHDSLLRMINELVEIDI